MTDGSGKGLFSARHRTSAKRRAAYQALQIEWTEARDAELMDHMAEDRSFTQTARLMGLSVSQVSSRFKRLREAMGWQAR